MSDSSRCGQTNILTLLLLFAGLFGSVSLQAQTAPTTPVQQPERNFGYFLGDVLRQQIYLEQPVAEVTLPGLDHAQRVSSYLVRLPGAQSRLVEGATESAAWLTLRYQIINAPSTAAQAVIPAFTLETEAGPLVNVPEWTFGISPLLPNSDTTAVNSGSLRPDRSAQSMVAGQSSAPLITSIKALSGLLAVWLLWWGYREITDRHRLPFAKAFQLIKRAARKPRVAGKDEAELDQWVALHRAFNATAGKSINQGSVGDLLQAAPWLIPQRQAIEGFYSASAARFYQRADQPASIDITGLCKQLYKTEKRQAGAPAPGRQG